MSLRARWFFVLITQPPPRVQNHTQQGWRVGREQRYCLLHAIITCALMFTLVICLAAWLSCNLHTVRSSLLKQLWRCTRIITSALGRLRQDDRPRKDGLGYTVRLCQRAECQGAGQMAQQLRALNVLVTSASAWLQVPVTLASGGPVPFLVSSDTCTHMHTSSHIHTHIHIVK